jgi:N6-adenosine-specific RNA methylase IME4
VAVIPVSPPLPPGPYDLILADPPWSFVSWGPKGNHRGADRHYRTMTTEAICALPIASAAADDAVLLLWSVWNRLPDALAVIAAWGFEYKTCAWVWVKRAANGDPSIGMGYYTRANAEPCLLATKGKPLPRYDRGIPNVLASQPFEHSQKPDGQYDRIERLFGKGTRRLELFARRRWPGWDAWGNEAPAEGPLMLPLEKAGHP